MTRTDRLGLTLLLALGLYLWFTHPALMAALLLAFLVLTMFVLSVMAVGGWRRGRVAETKAQRVLRIVNGRH